MKTVNLHRSKSGLPILMFLLFSMATIIAGIFLFIIIYAPYDENSASGFKILVLMAIITICSAKAVYLGYQIYILKKYSGWQEHIGKDIAVLVKLNPNTRMMGGELTSLKHGKKYLGYMTPIEFSKQSYTHNNMVMIDGQEYSPDDLINA